MTFRVTTAGKVEKSELPSDGTIRVRIVGAEVAGLDSGGEVMAECGDGVADFLDGLLDAFGDCRTGPFDVR